MNKLDIKISWELFKDKLKSIRKGKFGKFLKRIFTFESILAIILLVVYYLREEKTLEDTILTGIVVYALFIVDILKTAIKDSEKRILKAIKATKTDETKSST